MSDHIHDVLDNADVYTRLIDSTTGVTKVALRALLDLPAEVPLGHLTTYCTSLDDGSTVIATTGGVITAAGAIDQLMRGLLDPHEVLHAVIEQDLARPYEGEETEA